MGHRSGGQDRGRGDPLSFDYPGVGPRFHEDRSGSEGIRSGRMRLRIVCGALLVLMLGLAVAGNTDAAIGIGWVMLGPVAAVLVVVELVAVLAPEHD